MELTIEQITELGLTEENTSKVSTFLADQIANTKQEFEGLANKNAEKILDGALGKVFTDTNIARVQGEKAGDYIPRAWNEFNTSKIAEIETLKSEYGTKIKDFKGNEDLVSKITGKSIDNTEFGKNLITKSNSEHWNSPTGDWESDFVTREKNSLRLELKLEHLFLTSIRMV